MVLPFSKGELEGIFRKVLAQFVSQHPIPNKQHTVIGCPA
jgi:hypothetical protein